MRLSRYTIRVRRLTLLLLFLLASGCGNLGGSSASGISGMVVSSPGCPATAGRTPCPDRPLAFGIEVIEPSKGTVLTSFFSDSFGKFSMNLPPGDYTLRTLNNGSPRVVSGRTVQVKEGRRTEITIKVDSGIK